MPLLCSMTVWAVSQALLGNTEATIDELEKVISAAPTLSDFRKSLYVALKHPNLPSPIDTKIAPVKESNNCTFGYLS